jgi:hypothetical protein
MLLNLPSFLLTHARTECLYDSTEGHAAFEDALIIAIHCRANETLRFQILVNSEKLFANVPACALTNSQAAVKLTEEEAVWSIFSDERASICVLDGLKLADPCIVLKRDGSVWQNGSYVLTVEWERLREQLHLIELEDGNYCFWGNEGLRWTSE